LTFSFLSDSPKQDIGAKSNHDEYEVAGRKIREEKGGRGRMT
jgi:hypothetical protein